MQKHPVRAAIRRAVTKLRGKILRRCCKSLAEEGLRLDAENASLDARFALWMLERMAKKPRDTALPAEMAHIEALHTVTPDALSEDGFILRQRAFPEIRFGSRGNTADHGCGWVATYNVRRLLGEDVEPETVLRAVWRGARFGGRMGTDPFYLIGYFRALGYKTELISGADRMESAAKAADAFILLYFYDQKDCPGGHFVAGQYRAETDDYRMLNGEHGGDAIEPSLSAAQAKSTLLRLLITVDKDEEDE